MRGMELLRTIAQSTGLPIHMIEREVLGLIESRGLLPEQISLEDLREILATYLQSVLLNAKLTNRID